MSDPADPNFVASVPLQYVFLDKDTGTALASGVVTFYSDPEFTVKKSVYQLTGNPPDGEITFSALPNPLILSGIGTFVDPGGDNLVPYYFPYDGTPGATDPGDFQPYFVTVYSSDGILQFTLQEWPPNSLSGSTTSTDNPTTFNQITNPQFSVVSFTPNPATSTKVYNVSGTASRYPIAPGWELVTTGTGTVTVGQNSISESIPTEAPYSLTINGGSGVTEIQLVQRITQSPRLLSNPTTISEVSYVSGYLTARSTISTSASISMSYFPSNGVETLIFTDSTSQTHTFKVMTGTAAIDTPLSTDNASGYVDIIIDIAPLNTVEITSIQVVGATALTDEIPFIQQSTLELLNGLFWFYQPALTYKPVPSYTIGWDFPFNPCQALGTTVAVSGLAANKSRYIADQTIAFEAVANVLSYTFSEATGLNAATATATQFALVQYLDAPTAIELLQSNLMAVKLNANVNTGTLVGYVNIYWTDDATLPDITSGSNTSLVSGLTLGVPAVANGSWTQVERSGLGDAIFSLTTAATDINFTYWDARLVADIQTATFLAIVVSFREMSASQTLALRYCTLASGYFATNPPPLNKAQTLQALQYYYQMSFNPGIVPAGGVALGNGETSFVQTSSATSPSALPVNFATPMISEPTITSYSPVIANGSIYNVSTANNYGPGAIAQQNLSKSNIIFTQQSNVGSVIGNIIVINWTADARFGTF